MKSTEDVDVTQLVDVAPMECIQRSVILLCFARAVVHGFNLQAIAFAAGRRMKYRCATISFAGALLLASSASAQVKIGVNISLTGPAASLGIAAKNAIEILPTEIAGQKIEYIVRTSFSFRSAS